MKNTVVILCISILVLCACTNENKQSDKTFDDFSVHEDIEKADSFCTIPYNGLKNISITKDSVLIIEKSDQIFKIKLINNNYGVVEDFVNFFYETKGKFKTIHMEKADYSGDGNPDLFMENFIVGEDKIKIKRIISNQSKDVIWQDSILINDEPLFYFCNDSIGTLTYPYSMFFKAWFVSYISSYYKAENGWVTEFGLFVAKVIHHNRLQDKGIHEQKLEQKLEDFENYCYSYKGFLVEDLGYIDNCTYFFFPDSNRFILYYAP